MGTVVLAFDVGGTTVKAEVLDEDLRVVTASTVPTPRGPAVVDELAGLGGRLLGDLPDDVRGRVSAVGLAFPGIVDTVRGVSVYSANLGLRDTEVTAPLARALGLPVALGHDVVAAAEAERRCGAAADLVDPVVVVIGTGVFAVSYVDGRRVSGVSGQAGELGHLPVRPDGPACRCGARGCLEAVASAGAVARAYAAAVGREVDGAREVVAALGTDPVADRVRAAAAEALGDGLLAAVALLAPGAVVLGGGLAQAGPLLTDPVLRRMRLAGPPLAVPPLLTAAFGTRAGVVGAALLALDAGGEAG